MTTVASISGGIDSAAALWWAFERGPVNPEDTVCYTQYCVRRATNHTARAEAIAQASIMRWFDDHYPGVLWIKAGSVDWREWSHPIGTTEWHGFMRGNVARFYAASRVLLAGIAEDYRPANRPSPRFDYHDRILDAAAGKERETLEPFREMRKAEVMEMIPPDLLRLTWSCSSARRADGRFWRCNGADGRLCTECHIVRAALPVGEVGLDWHDGGLLDTMATEPGG